MRKINFIIIISLFAFLSSCNSDGFQEHEVGDSLIDNSTEVRLIDTFQIKSSTVKLDSLLTSGQSNILFGSYEDEFFGRIKSDFYAVVDLGGAFSLSEVEVSGNTEKVPIRFDSLVFISYPDGAYMGDTIPTQSMAIHRVTEEIEIPDDQIGFFDHTTFSYEEESLGSANFIAKPIKQASEYNETNEADVEFYRGGIRFKMDEALGLDIVRMVNTENDTVLFADKWNKYFQGVVLKAGEDNSLMLSYSLETGKMKMRLYYTYTENSLAGTQDFHDFSIQTSPLNFTNVKSDFSSAPYDLNQISDESLELSSEETGDLAFAHGGLGILTKIKIPYLEELNTIGSTGGVLKAELIFYPKDDSFDQSILKLPSNPFTLYQTDRKNQFLTQLPSVTGSGASSILDFSSGNMDEWYYSIDVTSYVNSVLANGQDFDDALLLTLPYSRLDVPVPANFMDRLVIENDPHSDFRIRLKTTYVVQK